MIYLASQSPRRRQLLDQLGVEYLILNVTLPEHWDKLERPPDYVQRLALEKATAGRELADQPLPVLGADTEVVINGLILGKPADRNSALDMLQQLSGQTHEVYTAVALVHGNSRQVAVNCSRISFRTLSLQECAAYIDTGEPFDKAGAYAIQGRAAAFITRLEGSYSGVMGLPLHETRVLLNDANACQPAPSS